MQHSHPQTTPCGYAYKHIEQLERFVFHSEKVSNTLLTKNRRKKRALILKNSLSVAEPNLWERCVLTRCINYGTTSSLSQHAPLKINVGQVLWQSLFKSVLFLSFVVKEITMETILEQQRRYHEEKERLLDAKTKEMMHKKTTVCVASTLMLFNVNEDVH